MPAVSSRNTGNVCLILIDNPPVNATSTEVRLGLMQALSEANADDIVQAIVIACEGSTFVAGADIKEFGRPPMDPHLATVIDNIERSAKPVVAAIHGTALGGGLELALGCHYRVADARARLGLPEATLGVIPGAGGIARLMRLVAPEIALNMVVSGKPLGSRAALDAGLIDEVAETDVRSAAITLANRLAASHTPVRRTRDLAVKPPSPAFLDDFRTTLQKSHRGQTAPFACVDIAQACMHLNFEDSVALSRQRFRELVESPEAQALRHAFFAERVAGKHTGLPKDAAEIRSAGVIGAGTMGTGITLCFLNADIPVVLVEQNEKVLAASVETIGKTYRNDVAKGRITATQMQARLDQLTPTLAYAGLSDADLIIEAVFESMDVKKEVFAQVDRVAKPTTIIASNTSYLNIDELAAAISHPERVVGMHFFSPAHIMKLLENVRAAKSSPESLASIQALGKRLGKVPVLVGVSDGFVGNRMLSKRTRESYFLLEEGALPQQVDQVLYDFGFPMGQFQMNDLAGLDVAWRNRQGRLGTLSAREVACNILDEVYATGRLGQKSGNGFYKYDEKRSRAIDPQISELIVNNSARRGIARRSIADQEILERCLYTMINEGAWILEEGVVGRPEDIDTIWINGYGFPRYRGGPMFHADRIGLKTVYDRILHYAGQVGPQYWTPAPLLRRLAESGGTFYAK